MDSLFKLADALDNFIKLELRGLAGSGKTLGALAIASFLKKKRIAVVCTERGRAAKYGKVDIGKYFGPAFSGQKFVYSVFVLEAPFRPERAVQALELASKEGFDVIILDSLSQFWTGVGGCMDMASDAGGSQYSWKGPKLEWKRLLDTINSLPAHVIFTVRGKATYDILKGKNSKGGDTAHTKAHSSAYECDASTDFDTDIILTIDQATNKAKVDKANVSFSVELKDELEKNPKITPNLGVKIREWLEAEEIVEAKPVSALKTVITTDPFLKEIESANLLTVPTEITDDYLKGLQDEAIARLGGKENATKLFKEFGVTKASKKIEDITKIVEKLNSVKPATYGASNG